MKVFMFLSLFFSSFLLASDRNYYSILVQEEAHDELWVYAYGEYGLAYAYGVDTGKLAKAIVDENIGIRRVFNLAIAPPQYSYKYLLDHGEVIQIPVTLSIVALSRQKDAWIVYRDIDCTLSLEKRRNRPHSLGFCKRSVDGTDIELDLHTDIFNAFYDNDVISLDRWSFP